MLNMTSDAEEGATVRTTSVFLISYSHAGQEGGGTMALLLICAEMVVFVQAIG